MSGEWGRCAHQEHDHSQSQYEPGLVHSRLLHCSMDGEKSRWPMTSPKQDPQGEGDGHEATIRCAPP
jgi:hypothetical protein